MALKVGSLTDRDIGWIAGIVEGEGCVDTSRNNCRIVVGMTDRDIVRKFADLTHARWREDPIPRSQRDPPHKDMYWAVCQGRHAIALGYMLWPLVGERRQARITRMIAKWKTRANMGHHVRTHCINGHEYIPGSYYMAKHKATGRQPDRVSKRCKACHKEANRRIAARKRAARAAETTEERAARNLAALRYRRGG